MAEYLVHTWHEPEDCGKLYEEWVKYDTPLKSDGKTFFCGCPSGEHGGFTHIDAASEDAVRAMFPELHRQAMKVYSGETLPLNV